MFTQFKSYVLFQIESESLTTLITLNFVFDGFGYSSDSNDGKDYFV